MSEAVVFLLTAIFKKLMQGMTNGHHYLDAVCFTKCPYVNSRWQVTRRTTDEILCGRLQKAISPIHGCTPPLCAE